jgi:hypothetical protein
MAYANASELRQRIGKVGSTDDEQLTALLSAAERNIDRTCNRPDGFLADTSATARVYAGSGKPYQWIDECIEITAVAVKETATSSSYTAWGSGDYIEASGDPKYPNYNATPYTLLVIDPTGDEAIFTSGKYTTRGGFKPVTDVTRGAPTVQVTAKWGFASSVPADIKEACLMQAARWYKREESAMADVLASGELGQLMYMKSLDPDIKRLLVDGRYVRPNPVRR